MRPGPRGIRRFWSLPSAIEHRPATIPATGDWLRVTSFVQVFREFPQFVGGRAQAAARMSPHLGHHFVVDVADKVLCLPFQSRRCIADCFAHALGRLRRGRRPLLLTFAHGCSLSVCGFALLPGPLIIPPFHLRFNRLYLLRQRLPWLYSVLNPRIGLQVVLTCFQLLALVSIT